MKLPTLFAAVLSMIKRPKVDKFFYRLSSSSSIIYILEKFDEKCQLFHCTPLTAYIMSRRNSILLRWLVDIVPHLFLLFIRFVDGQKFTEDLREKNFIFWAAKWPNAFYVCALRNYGALFRLVVRWYCATTCINVRGTRAD